MDAWTPPTPILTQALLDRIQAEQALPSDTTQDTPAQRDMRNLLGFVGYAAVAAKQNQVAGNPDYRLQALFDPAVLSAIELP